MSTEPSTSWIRRWERIRRRLPAINPVIMGHPLHALSTDLPAALIPTGFAFSLWGRVARQPELERAGYVNTAAGVALAIPTALFGIADYLQMDVDDPAQTTGLTHGLLNLAAVGVGIASLAGRNLKELTVIPYGALSVHAVLGRERVLVSKNAYEALAEACRG